MESWYLFLSFFLCVFFCKLKSVDNRLAIHVTPSLRLNIGLFGHVFGWLRVTLIGSTKYQNENISDPTEHASRLTLIIPLENGIHHK